MCICLFIECSPGFYEKNCSSPCRYPNYRLSCQNNCQCSSAFCSNVLGCHSNNINALNMVRKPIKQGKYERYLSCQIIHNDYICNKFKSNTLNFWYKEICGFSMFVLNIFLVYIFETILLFFNFNIHRMSYWFLWTQLFKTMSVSKLWFRMSKNVQMQWIGLQQYNRMHRSNGYNCSYRVLRNRL